MPPAVSSPPTGCTTGVPATDTPQLPPTHPDAGAAELPVEMVARLAHGWQRWKTFLNVAEA